MTKQEALGLARRAGDKRDSYWGNVITYSPKVFIPLTKLCRDVCHYCTFARPPVQGRKAFMTVEEVLEVARAGAEAGCKEALFTLGDKPELRYAVARDELASMGYASTLEYLEVAARAVLDETGLLPHLNPGILTASDMARLRDVAPSMGLMLESTSRRLLDKGQAHHGSPDKDPVSRLRMLDEAGRQRIPFTTGLLIGIGETWQERADTLQAIEDSHAKWGHVQEVIVQNFSAKPDTLMRDHPEPTFDDMFATIVLARLILSPDISVQAPPNLADEHQLGGYIDAGINDWGGVSTVTIDHVNPEAPWPELPILRQVTESKGFMLVPRLTVYPRYVMDATWIARKVRSKVLAQADTAGLVHDADWFAGAAETGRAFTVAMPSSVKSRPGFLDALENPTGELTEDDITLLLSARGQETVQLVEAADRLRREVNGDTVTFVVNRNINYTNMCYFKCGFCAFSKGPKSLNLRGDPYLLDFDEIAQRTIDAESKGATEVCLQGGIHPSFTGDFYLDVVRSIKRAVPSIHIHAFSPLEIWQGAETKGVTIKDFLWELKDEGLSTLPGTAAEILDDEVRAIICPDKITTQQWSHVAETAHGLGLRMTTTMMFGHADSFRSWARHLVVLRNIQKRTGGFTEFVPLPFVHMGAPIYLGGKSRKGPTLHETIKVHAVSRLALHPWIKNIQTSWVKMGESGARLALEAGANDLGGTLMNESISRAAGASHGQELGPSSMRRLAAQANRPCAQRTTLYELIEPSVIA
ncbi:MAG: 5-amino-6-(D-ribitylamino)uracil--L-tyrosine 4-hydroxyphenyl transferase CofH [Actinomycetota bacterium]